MRCAIYIRVSTDKEEQKASLKYQQELFYRYIKEQGWDIYEFYVDVQSGTTAKRKNLQKMIKDAEEKKFDIILAKELSRLARNGELSYKIKNLCENQGIHIITLDNAINTTTGNTNMFGLYAWMYEQESENTSNRVKETLRTRAQKGLFKGSSPPFGYEVRGGKLHIRNDDSPDIVRRIFSEYLRGAGRESIARGLYNDGISTPAEVAGKKNANDKWNDSTIRLILSNPHYVGDLVQGRTTTVSVTSKKRKKVKKEHQIIHKDIHEAIIPREMFNTVQQQMKVRTKYITAPKKHLFTNILYCADCGKGLWYRSNRKGYICGNYARHGKKACSSHFVKEEHLTNTILTDIKLLVKQINKEEYLKQLELKTKKSKHDLMKRIDKANKQILVFKKRKGKYINMLADEQITHEDYRENVEASNIEIEQLVKKKNELLSKIEDEQVIDSIEKLKEELLSFLNFNELSPEILSRLVNRIEVNEDSSFNIHYRFSAPIIE
ncbi:recombinase family protein [Cytobacillus sp. IB215665]|uniref:recombinase family protein n=1 Tax=Cytobacillus sp. IB215665 TaxID=3097357 RepID=UPI002A0AD588|nr:recombinase family protein [Cytobacillus sp. IB215665]MDX8365228.1 recombinase family protein [Cytobacillus sp. IB215665]